MEVAVKNEDYKKYWDGDSLPKNVKNILDNNDLFLTGSSLIHDHYFLNENWEDRDYDIWGNRDDINAAIDYLKKTNDNIEIEELDDKESEYKYEFLISSIKNVKCGDLLIQFLEFYLGTDIYYVIENTDFSFLKLYYHKNYIYYFVDENDIKQRVGTISKKYSKTSMDPTNKIMQRVKKYHFRWFNFTNLCKSCHKYAEPDIAHYKNCIRKKYLHNQIDQVLKFSLSYPDNKLFIAILTTFITSKIPEDFIKLYNYYTKNHNIKINIHDEDDYLFRYAAIRGMATICKFLYMISLDENQNSKINISKGNHMTFNQVVNLNYIKTAEFLCLVFPEYSMKIVDDIIVDYEIESLFDIYARTKDKNIVIKKLKGECKLCENNEDEICAICKTAQVEASLKCNHNFCMTCLTLWLNHNQSCPYCSEVLTY